MTTTPEGVPHAEEPTGIYEIRLRGASAARLRRQFPSATVMTTRTETVLRREVDGQGELDDLLSRVLSLGLVLTEVQRVDQRHAPTRATPQERGAR